MKWGDVIYYKTRFFKRAPGLESLKTFSVSFLSRNIMAWEALLSYNPCNFDLHLWYYQLFIVVRSSQNENSMKHGKRRSIFFIYLLCRILRSYFPHGILYQKQTIETSNSRLIMLSIALGGMHFKQEPWFSITNNCLVLTLAKYHTFLLRPTLVHCSSRKIPA